MRSDDGGEAGDGSPWAPPYPRRFADCGPFAVGLCTNSALWSLAVAVGAVVPIVVTAVYILTGALIVVGFQEAREGNDRRLFMFGLGAVAPEIAFVLGFVIFVVVYAIA